MRAIEREGLELLEFEELGDGVTAVVTTRAGGSSAGGYASLNLGDHVGDDPGAVAANRARVADALVVERLVIADQQHQARVAVVGGGAPPDLMATDAMVTDTPGVALAILVADCVPVVLWDPVRRALGVAHAGRNGAILGVVPAAIATMGDRFGTKAAHLRVGIGPHIAGGSYEVGPEEVAAVEHAFPHLEVCAPTAGGHACFDLERAVRHQLTAAGVAAHSVESAGIDTLCDDRFFSHRAERPCGRFALVALVED